MLYLSILPFIFFALLLLIFKVTLFKASLFTSLLTLILTLVFWQVPNYYVFASISKGFFVALDIFFIIFGALVFLSLLQNTGIMTSLVHHLEKISSDVRVQVILLAWFLENFIEGTAGFGTPAAIVAPILVRLGLKPLQAAVIALLGNSASVAFGAAGTPIRVGFASLDVGGLVVQAALINIVGAIVPAFMLITLLAGRKNKKKLFFDSLPFALWSGFVFSLASFIASFMGNEFPSIVGSVLSLLIILISLKLGIFVPRDTPVSFGISQKNQKPLSLVNTIFPYLLLIITLIIGKFLIGNHSIYFSFINYKFSLYNPGLIFFLVSLFISFSYSGLTFLPQLMKKSFINSLNPFLVIVFMSVMVQLMVSSSQNPQSLPSIIDCIASLFNNSLLTLWTPFIGAFGSFITGSATISNVMFAPLLATASASLNIPLIPILALQLVGASAGNMIALADVLAAETVLGLKNQELSIVKGVGLACLTYLILASFIGFVFIR